MRRIDALRTLALTSALILAVGGTAGASEEDTSDTGEPPGVEAAPPAEAAEDVEEAPPVEATEDVEAAPPAEATEDVEAAPPAEATEEAADETSPPAEKPDTEASEAEEE
jgi:hypothetical protein